MTHFRTLWLLTLVLLAPFSAPITGVASDQPFDHDYVAWHHLLDKNSKNKAASTRVDYQAIQTHHAEADGLDPLLKTFSGISKSEFDKFSPDQRLAFLINAYNVYTIKLIADHYPLTSIKDLGSLFKKPWGIRFVPLLGEDRTLDEIEHDLIRKQFNEPRIHLALVCAAKGCPPLRAYTATHLSAELEDTAHTFLNDPKRNRLNASEHRLELGKIFDWYQDDFKKKFGAVKKFVAPRMSGADHALEEKILSDATEIEYLPYDWSLNDTAANDL